MTKGIPKDRSAIMAGATVDAVPFFEASPTVQQELAKIRTAVRENTGITREQIVEMLMEAAGYAKLLGDPMGMIAAARELGKMLGFYAPEVKKIEKGINAQDLRKALKDMNDEDLYKLANAKVIDGEFTRVPGVPQTQSAAAVLPAPASMQEMRGGSGSGRQSDAGAAGLGTPEEETA